MSTSQGFDPKPGAADPFTIHLFGRQATIQNAVELHRALRGVGFLLVLSGLIGYAAGALHLPERQTGEITVNTNPPGATIFVDGMHRGSPPLKVSGLTPGTHKLKAVMPGYRGVVLQVEVSPSRKENLDWMLEPSIPASVHRQLALSVLPASPGRPCAAWDI